MKALMQEFMQKACCYWSQRQTFGLWCDLRAHLTSEERREILIAWDHYWQGEGRDEFDAVCKRVLRRAQ